MIRFLFSCFFTVSGCLGVHIHQSPSDVLRKPGEDVQLICTHQQKDYRVMLWYQRPHGQTAINLIGYVDYSRIIHEELYKSHFNITGDLSSSSTAMMSSLHIVDVKASEHSAVYYCAARDPR
ncbi:hypothetical protein LDENG_00101640 [Lucifuga dentata]|nr:hypothetical protein LDENG_00101640 [Lucifuga dentata]